MPTSATRSRDPVRRQKPRKRVVSPQRPGDVPSRRAVALVVVLAAVSLVVFCVYSLGRGVVDGVSCCVPHRSRVNRCGAEEDQRRQ